MRTSTKSGNCHCKQKTTFVLLSYLLQHRSGYVLNPQYEKAKRIWKATIRKDSANKHRLGKQRDVALSADNSNLQAANTWQDQLFAESKPATVQRPQSVGAGTSSCKLGRQTFPDTHYYPFTQKEQNTLGLKLRSEVRAPLYKKD